MLLQTFELNEIVQILDPETYIWESAKIIAFISDWSLKIQWINGNNRWINWDNRLDKIEIPLEFRDEQNMWNVRKARQSQPVLSKKRSKPLSFKPNRLQKNDPVTFWLRDCDCLRHCLIDSHGQIKTGKIATNDPFAHECVVEMDEMLHYVPYCCLKNQVEDTDVHDEEAEDDEKAQETKQEHRQEPKPKRTKTQETELDFSTLIPKTDVDVKLSFVPCINGICQRGSIIALSGMDFKVNDLYYSAQKFKPIAMMISVDDEDCELRMPVTTCSLKVSDYLKNEEINFVTLDNDVDRTFAVFSAIKRCVGLSFKKSSTVTNFIPSTELTKRVCGFKSNSSKEAVKFSIEVESGSLGSYHSLDFILGQNWDIIPDVLENEPDTLIKSLKFTEHREFMMFSIRCHITTTEGRYKKNEDHRRSFRDNIEIARSEYYIDL